MQNQIKLGLIDDEPLALERLSYFISGIPGYEAVFAVTNPIEGLRLASLNACDILITDVQMEKLNGLLISEKMEELGVPVIICSAHQEFALPSINVSVAAYLLKPVNVLDLKKTLEKVSRKMNIAKQITFEAQRDYLLVEDFASFGYTKVLFHSLYYVEQAQNYSHFHVPPHVYKQRSTLESVERSLPSSTFIRIQKSYLINVSKLTKILPHEVILEDGTELPLGSGYRDKLLDAYKLVTRP